jgi:YHS domain-containing protein
VGPQSLDVVCKMTVDLDEARSKGLVSIHAGREYGFCGAGCKRAFEKDPQRYLR